MSRELSLEVWEFLSPVLPLGSYTPTEGTTDPSLQVMDRFAKLDGYQVFGKAPETPAIRFVTQKTCFTGYYTFTTNFNCYPKFIHWLDTHTGSIPHMQIQSIWERTDPKPTLIAAGAIWFSDLLNYLRHGNRGGFDVESQNFTAAPFLQLMHLGAMGYRHHSGPQCSLPALPILSRQSPPLISSWDLPYTAEKYKIPPFPGNAGR